MAETNRSIVFIEHQDGHLMAETNRSIVLIENTDG